MDLQELLDSYRHSAWTYKPNKFNMPQTTFCGDEEVDKWNSIYEFCVNNYFEVKPTKSGAMPYSTCKFNERFMIHEIKGKSIELVLMTLKGCFRFVYYGRKLAEDEGGVRDTQKGTKALKILFKKAREHGVIDVFAENTTTKEEALELKKEMKYNISVCDGVNVHQTYENCHHIDFNSSFASRIIEKYPRLRPLYEELYALRKDNEDYKLVLNASIGMMQSPYCLSPFGESARKGYCLTKFAHTAVVGTYRAVRFMYMALVLSGRKPLLINTDGIWYQGNPYHDRDEGTELGQWKHDHMNCKLYIKSAGAYMYQNENEDFWNPVCRGKWNLDSVKPDRRTWTPEDIENDNAISYKFVKGKGIIRNGKEEQS